MAVQEYTIGIQFTNKNCLRCGGRIIYDEYGDTICFACGRYFRIPMTPQAKGHLGGEKVVRIYGEKYMKEIGKRGYRASLKKFGLEFLREHGKVCGATTFAKYGREHYSWMGKRSWELKR